MADKIKVKISFSKWRIFLAKTWISAMSRMAYCRIITVDRAHKCASAIIPFVTRGVKVRPVK